MAIIGITPNNSFQELAKIKVFQDVWQVFKYFISYEVGDELMSRKKTAVSVLIRMEKIINSKTQLTVSW